MPDVADLSFTRPWLLLALAAPVLMAAWEVMRTGVVVRFPFDHVPTVRLKPFGRTALGAAVVGGNLLPALVLALAIVMLAGPRKAVSSEPEKQLTNIQVVLDVSGSMMAAFGEGTRYDAAMQAVADFTTHREGDAFGLTIFGNEVLHWVPLTQDASAVRYAPPFLQPYTLPRGFGGTSIGHALREVRQLLTRADEGDRMVILITDGYSSDLGAGQDARIAQELREDGITVYPIMVGSVDPPAAMYTIAGLTDGEVFAATDPAALDAVFGRIDQMQVARLRPPGRAYEDWFGPWSVLGLGLIGAHALALLGLRHTPW